ncbi:amiloride-sensitive sodium channel subunit beta-2 [Exaiptasia diaphana]|uniref:Amiloride-sensitive sodium channel n=1 Tax=Exaiptasia diaphana TaxID=2652724 RepID=A0A913WPH4_EXADI|nr:amiloride-sensitive sodium channel subunit beta-2 [Exaiptasia diaphana]
MDSSTDVDPSKTTDHKEHRSLKTVLKDFLEYSTAHGFGRLAASKEIYWKTFWVVAIISIHITFWYHFFVILRDYMNKPIATKVSMERNKVLDFPVVTICNRNMLRQSKLTKKMKSDVEKIRNITSEHWKNYTHNRRNILQHDTDSELLHFMHDRLEALRHMVSDTKSKTLREMGHQFKDMVIDCVFAGEDCREEKKLKHQWRHLWIDPVGNCYMFNRVLPGDDSVPHKTFLTGDQYGLRLLINIEQSEYIYGISPYAGLKVVIGPQGQMPFPLSEGINVGPGLSTNIEVVMKQAKRLDPFKNNSCKRTESLEPTNIYHQYNMTYSKMACRMSCLSNMQKNRCKCSQFHYTDDPTTGYCKSLNASVSKLKNR